MAQVMKDFVSEARYRRIVMRLAKGVNGTDVAKEEGISYVTVYRYINIALLNGHLVKNTSYTGTNKLDEYLLTSVNP